MEALWIKSEINKLEVTEKIANFSKENKERDELNLP